uniref:CD59 glycoprotein-like n=1 Tax=Tetraodon nigroviridis TaxID=99883 RepID=H3BX97_TETNG
MHQSLAETKVGRVHEAALLNVMKFWVLALAAALLFSAGESLNCHRCVSKVPGGECELSVETCKPDKNGCAAARFLRSPFAQFQKCMSLESCNLLKLNAYINVKCCGDDMCNTF